MPRLFSLKFTTCAAALLTATAASADVTAEEVWNDWKDQFGIYGEDGITIGSETVSGGTVTVTDLSFATDDGTTKAEGTLASILFEENGDGTVSVSMSDSFPIMIEDQSGGTVKMSLNQSGLDMVVSGDPGAMNYAISADRYAIELDEIKEDGEPIKGDIRFVLNGLSGNYVTNVGETREIKSDLTTTSMDLFVDVTDADTGGTFLISGKFDALSFVADIMMPLGADLENPEDLFKEGFAVSGTYGYGSSSLLFDFMDGADSGSGTVTTGATALDFLLNGETMSYDAATNDLAMQITVPDMPFPINASLAKYGLGFEMPLSQTDEPAPFGLSFDLIDLSVNDEIWMLFDPADLLGRDPATLSLALSGTAKMFFDIMDPEQAAAMESADVPGELHSLSLDQLKLALAGALLTGEGSFVFDNSESFTIPGMPKPEGQVTVNIKGGNKLIDTLVDMGLLPPDQAMGARMMMGMFARTVGDDELTSTIEVNSQGHVLANGQRIQ